MFQIGDLVLYGNTGVCRIANITNQGIPGADGKQLYYVLEPVYQEHTIIYTPTDAKVFMRPVISREEAEKLIDLIPTIRVKTNHNRAVNELTEHYKSFFLSHTCADLIELTMSIYAKRLELAEQKRKVGAVDERFLKQAEDLLFEELAIALGIPKDGVPEYIEQRVNRAAEECSSS